MYQIINHRINLVLIETSGMFEDNDSSNEMAPCKILHEVHLASVIDSDFFNRSGDAF